MPKSVIKSRASSGKQYFINEGKIVDIVDSYDNNLRMLERDSFGLDLNYFLQLQDQVPTSTCCFPD